jgi:hypothetical protein
MSRQKKVKKASVRKTGKRQLISSTNSPEQKVELWRRHFDCLNSKDKEVILSETRAARAAGGSRLAIAMHLLVVRDMLVGDATNPTQKKLWSAYLAVFLPGLCISRSQLFIDIAAAQSAKQMFSPVFLQTFIEGGYALRVRPTAEEPLGKYTNPCTRILKKLESAELDERQCATVLADASAIIKAEARKNRVAKPALTAEEKRNRILADLHNTTIKYFEDLSKAIEPGDSYESKDVYGDLQDFVSRLMTAMGVDALEPFPRRLPDGFTPLSIPGLVLESSEESIVEPSDESDVDSSKYTSTTEGKNDEAAMSATAA